MLVRNVDKRTGGSVVFCKKFITRASAAPNCQQTD